MACDDDSMFIYGYILQCSCGILSLLGSLIIIIIKLNIPDLSSFYHQIIFHIAIIDSIRSIIFIYPYIIFPNNYLCDALAISLNSLNVSGIFCSILIPLSFYKVSIDHFLDFKKTKKFLIFFSLLISPVLNTFPILTNSFGFSFTLCTFKQDFISRIWQYAFFYFPSSILIFVSVYCFVKINRLTADSQIDRKIKIIFKKVVLYPSYLIFCILALMTLRVFEENNNLTCFWYGCYIAVQALFQLRGLVNCLIFVFTKEVKRKCRAYFKEPKKQNVMINSFAFSDTNLLETSDLEDM